MSRPMPVEAVTPTMAATSEAPSTTATFDHAVTGFTVEGLLLENATAVNFSGSGALYHFDLAPAGVGQVEVGVRSIHVRQLWRRWTRK